MTLRSTAMLAAFVVLPWIGAQQSVAEGVCSDALRAGKKPAASAEERPFPIQCNWNYIFALEGKMLRLGDLERLRSPEAYDDQIDPVAVKRAQRRVGLPETGIVDATLFSYYMSLE